MTITINNDVIHGSRMCRGLACLSRESTETLGIIETALKNENAGSQTILILESMVENYRTSLGSSDPAALQPLLQLIRTAGHKKQELIGFLNKFSSKNKENPEILKALINLAKRIGTGGGVAALLTLRGSPNFKPAILANEAFCREFTRLVGQLSGAGSDIWTILESSLSDSKFTPDYGGMKELASQFAEMRGRFSPQILKIMAKELKAADGNMHVGEVFNNLKYALATIGEPMTVHLNNRFGLIYFSRYSRGTLQQAYNDLHFPDHDKKPILLIIFNKNDDNGAFYWVGKTLDAIREHFRIAIFETDLGSSESASQRSVYSIVKDVWDSYGKIDSVIVAGHGNKDSILLGGAGKRGKISTSDKLRLARLKFAFVPKPTVLSLSCSTGQGPGAVGAMFQEAWGAGVYAPKEDASKIELDYQDGQLKAEFGVANRWLYFYNMTNYYPPPE
jgi:hypothetical protein